MTWFANQRLIDKKYVTFPETLELAAWVLAVVGELEVVAGDLETVPRGFVIRALDLQTGNPALLRTKWRQENHVDKWEKDKDQPELLPGFLDTLASALYLLVWVIQSSVHCSDKKSEPWRQYEPPPLHVLAEMKDIEEITNNTDNKRGTLYINARHNWYGKYETKSNLPRKVREMKWTLDSLLCLETRPRANCANVQLWPTGLY